MFNQILLGDCLELMSNIQNSSVDMILCDLPYGTTACKWDIIIPFEPLWEHYKRIIKPNGAIVLTATQPFTSLLITSNLNMFKYQWVWEKTMATGGYSSKYQPMRAHEDICIFAHNGTKTTYNQQRLPGESYKRPEGKKRSDHYMGKAKEGGHITVNDGGRCPRSVIKISNPNSGSIHPTQKPVALFEYLIKTYTNPGEIVLDNCIGSGTTAIACMNTGRNFIGIEKDSLYYQKALERINNHIIEV